MSSVAPRRWILVVEDDARLREAWLEALEVGGYAAVGCEDGLAAIDLIRDLFPDLILLDLQMPRMSGWDFLEVMRRHQRWQRIPVLIVSGFLEDPRRARVEEGLRIVGRVEKPVGLHQLLDEVRAAVGPGQPGDAKAAAP